MFHSIAFLAVAVASANQADSNYERLKSLNWAMGNWQRDATIQKDSDLANKGDKSVQEWRLAWTANKNAVSISNTIIVNGKSVGQLDSLFGWNKKKQEIIGYGFASKGVAGGDWTIDTREKKFTITAGSSDWRFELKSQDRMILTTAKGAKHGFRRVKK